MHILSGFNSHWCLKTGSVSAGHARILARNEKGNIWINLITGYFAPPRLVTGVDVFTGAAPGFHECNLHPQWRALGCDWSPWSLWSTKGLEHSISSLQLSLINCILFWQAQIVQSGKKVFRENWELFTDERVFRDLLRRLRQKLCMRSQGSGGM